MQKWGQDFGKISNDLREIDKVVEELVNYFTSKNAGVILLSEYGITNVNQPIHLNRTLRENGLVAIRVEKRSGTT